MATQRYDFAVPVGDPMVGPDRKITPIYLRWFNAVRDRFGILTERTQTYDPPNIPPAAGPWTSITVSFPGAKPLDTATASHSGATSGIIILATPTTDSVTVTFINVTGAPIDIPNGTLLVSVESKT